MTRSMYTAMVTPFQANGEVDNKRLEVLIDHLIATGSDGLVVSGTTGESPTLTDQEKIALFEKTVELVDGRVPVIAGTGTNSTNASRTLTKAAEEAGVDEVMLVAPYYNKPDQRGLYEHFRSVARETTLPVMLYNVPKRTGVNIEAETTIALSKVENITSVKEASGDLDQVTHIIANKPDGFYVYSGDDAMTLPILALGGDGVVSVASHVIGNQLKEMIAAYQFGDVREAATLHQQLLPVMNALFAQPSPAPVKEALAYLGIETGPVRQPLRSLLQQEQDDLHMILKKLEQPIA